MAPNARSVVLSADMSRYKDLQAASAAIALGMLGSGVPMGWAPWVIAGLIGGQEAFIRMPMSIWKEFLNDEQFTLFEA